MTSLGDVMAMVPGAPAFVPDPESREDLPPRPLLHRLTPLCKCRQFYIHFAERVSRCIVCFLPLWFVRSPLRISRVIRPFLYSPRAHCPLCIFLCLRESFHPSWVASNPGKFYLVLNTCVPQRWLPSSRKSQPRQLLSPFPGSEEVLESRVSLSRLL
ncbi:serine-rich and transmembrane domain-containing protein 1 isoform X1 [Herpailurus yagouaroundi]|uniref:serine-rich and transmembrane domain-containing protein 1 isoform X1 n=1 Tax=Herpailurus yagouaroundi TaxID=1608482 RepID=UPI001AD65A70|nr:serine-rich and transmembrane domain-containing protein 1 isoform X1 [Puma yagouaroundi]